jgi:hypothetical protein
MHKVPKNEQSKFANNLEFSYKATTLIFFIFSVGRVYITANFSRKKSKLYKRFKVKGFDGNLRHDRPTTHRLHPANRGVLELAEKEDCHTSHNNLPCHGSMTVGVHEMLKGAHGTADPTRHFHPLNKVE